MKAAVIGIGSNSVRCLLAETGDGAFNRIWRGREGTRLFAGLDGQGNLNPESMEKTVAAVAQMAREARERGAESLSVFATSAAGRRSRRRSGRRPGSRRGSSPARKRRGTALSALPPWRRENAAA